MAQSEIAPGRRKLISTDRLRKVDFLQGLAEGELGRIAHFFEEENVGAGVSLCQEGARAERLYVLEQGRISISSKHSRQYDIDTPGKTVGWSFLVPPFRYTASAVTTAPSKLLVIKSPEFYDFIHNDSQMEVKVLSNMAQVIASRLGGHKGPYLSKSFWSASSNDKPHCQRGEVTNSHTTTKNPVSPPSFCICQSYLLNLFISFGNDFTSPTPDLADDLLFR